eukprot:jgi/Mesvir1/9194/Mv15945-RA.1
MDEDKQLAWHFRWPVDIKLLTSATLHSSPAFEHAGYSWRIELRIQCFEKKDVKWIGLYLKSDSASTQPEGWSCSVKFRLEIENASDPTLSVAEVASADGGDKFTELKKIWGWKTFLRLQHIHDKGFLKDDTVFITACLLSCRPQPAPPLAHDYDSKKATGYVGLKVQGGVQCANALLQTLYHIPCFRQAVYHVPAAEMDGGESSISTLRELQGLFFYMQHRDGSADASTLLKTMEWATCQWLAPLSSGDLARLLCQSLDGTWKGFAVEGAVRRLFEVQVDKCSHGGNATANGGSCTEPLYTLQLDVQGCKDVHASLDKCTAMAAGVRLKDLPPALMLQLNHGKPKAGSDKERYEFPQELDLDVDGRKYWAPGGNASTRNLYELHSVIVEDRDSHCSAFVRPGLGNQWYRFDDERVTKASAVAAMSEQYGGESKGCSVQMLLYVRKSDRERVMCTLRKEDMAPRLLERLARDSQEKPATTDGDTHLTVRVATEDDLTNQIGKTQFFDLVDFSQVKAFHVAKTMPLKLFGKMVEAELGVPAEEHCFWTWAKRQNQTYRPVTCYGHDCDEELVSILDESITDETAVLDLLLDRSGGVKPSADKPLLFFKLYDPVEEKLSFACRVIPSFRVTLRAFQSYLCQLAGYPARQPLQVYQEVRSQPGVLCPRLRETLLLSECKIRTGDILCFQKALPPDVAARCRFPDVPSFLQHARELQSVRFRHLANPEKDVFVLALSKTDTFDQVVARVQQQVQKQVTADGDTDRPKRAPSKGNKDSAERAVREGTAQDSAALKDANGTPSEPLRVRLTTHDAYHHAPRWQPISCQGADSLLRVLACSGAASDVLYYEVLDPMGRSRVVSISVHDQRSEVACFRVPLPPGSTVADVLKLVKAERECAHLGELVVTRVRDGRIHKVLSLTEVIDDVDDGYWSLQVTEKEPQAEPGARLLPVSHVRRNDADGSSERVTAFGQPFLLAIGEQEKLASVKTRLQAKLGAAAKEFARCKFAIVVVDTAVYLDDDDVVLGKYQTLQAGRWDAWPAVVHPAQPRSTPRKRSREEAATPEKEAAPKRLEPRTLRGLQWKRELFLPTFAESAFHTAQDPQRLLLEASSSHVDASGRDTWHLAQRTQNLGRALWDTMLELSTLRTSLRTTDDEGQRLSEACRGTEAALMEAVAAAREKPLDAAALSARDQAMEGQMAALRRLEESYARKAALAGERVKQKQMLEGLTRGGSIDLRLGLTDAEWLNRPGTTDAGGLNTAGATDGGGGGASRPIPVDFGGASGPGATDGGGGGLSRPIPVDFGGASGPGATDGGPPGSTDVAMMNVDGPKGGNPDVDGPENSGQDQARGKAKTLSRQLFAPATADADVAQAVTMDNIQDALALAGVAVKECNDELMPAAAATQAAAELLAKCLARQRAVMARVKGKLDQAHDAGARVIGSAVAVMGGETPAEDAEQAGTLRALVKRKREQLAEMMAAREGLHPTEVRLGMLQRDLRDVKKQKVQARAHLEIAELDEKEKEAAELRRQLDELEDKQRGIVSDLNKLTAEAEDATRKMTQYYPEVAALPERASRLSKALPSATRSNNNRNSGAGDAGSSRGAGSGGDIVDPDWSLACFRDGMGRPLGSSKIRVVEDREGNSWVIKELCREKELRREGSRLEALRHPLVIRLERIFFDGGLAYLQMPYCKNGSLRGWFETIKARTREGHPLPMDQRQQVWVTMRQVFQAVAFIHRKGVVHRDLKPENILLQDDGQIAVCDFGVSHDASRAFQTTLATHAAGFTTAYAPPEVLADQPSAKRWPFAQDMWSLGIMLTELLTGSLPVWNAAAGCLEDDSKKDAASKMDAGQGRPVSGPDASSNNDTNNGRNNGSNNGSSSQLHQGDPWTAALRVLAFALVQVDPALRPSAEDALSDPQGFLARDLTQVAAEQQRRMHALSSFLESLRRCPARVAGRAHVLKVTDLDNRPQLVEQMLEVFAADGLDLQVLFSVECGGIRVPLSEALDRFFQAVVLPEAGLFEQGREGREDVSRHPCCRKGWRSCQRSSRLRRARPAEAAHEQAESDGPGACQGGPRVPARPCQVRDRPLLLPGGGRTAGGRHALALPGADGRV